MKTISFLLLLFGITFCVCFPAFAQDKRWTFVGEDMDGNSFFIDKTSRKVSGNRVRAWEKGILRNGSYRINLTEWKCDEEMYFPIDSTVYSPGGSFIKKEKGTEWVLVVPGAINEAMYKFACGDLPKNSSKNTSSAGKMMVEIIVDKANLRDAPSRNSRIIREVSIGERFTLVSKELVSYFWYQIILPGTNETAWIHYSTIKLVESPIKSKPVKRRKQSNR